MKGRKRVVHIGHLALRQRQRAGHQAGIIGQGGHGGAGIIGQNIGQPLGRQHQRQLRALHLAFQMRGQLQRHQLHDRQRVGGRPCGDLVGKEEKLRRPPATGAAVDLGNPRIHPGRIGRQRRRGLRVLHLDRALGEGVDVQPPQQLVNLGGAGAENLGQAALRGASQHGHLPEPVLRMNESQRIEGVRLGSGKDMRHIVVVAHDIDLLGDSGQGEILVIIGQRAAKDVIGQQNCHQTQTHKGGKGTQKPAEGEDHGAAVLDGIDAMPS